MTNRIGRLFKSKKQMMEQCQQPNLCPKKPSKTRQFSERCRKVVRGPTKAGNNVEGR